MSKLYSGIAKALKLDAEWLATLKDGEDWRSEDEVAEIVSQTISERVKAAVTNSRTTGQREINDQLRKFVKSVGFDNPENLQGRELLEAFDAWRVETADPGKKPAEMTEDELVKLPAFKKVLNARLSEAKQAVEAAKAEAENTRKQAKQARVADLLKPWLSQTLEEAKVVLEVPGSTISKQNRIDAIFRQLDPSKIAIDEKGNPYMLDDDGESPKADTFGKPFDLKKHIVNEIAAPLYGIHTQNPNHGGGNPNPAGAQGAKDDWKPTMRFANQAEYDAFKLKEPDPAKRLEATKSWQHQQQTETAGK
jgi:hypothetical protein